MAVTGTLDAEARRELMAQELQRRGTLHLKDAALRWGVHPMTIAPDFYVFVHAGITPRARSELVALPSPTTVRAFDKTMAATRTSVITNGFSAFQALCGREGIRTYLTGGEREETNLSLVGSLAVQSVQQFSLDACFLSTMSIDPDFGTSEITLEQVAVKQAMVNASQKVILAVDSSKFATRARFRSLSLSHFDVLVTELDPNDTRLNAYREFIPEIH